MSVWAPVRALWLRPELKVLGHSTKTAAMAELVSIAVFASRMEASVARNLLESNGIQAAVFADDGGGLYPPFGEGVRLLVRQEDAHRAHEILGAPPTPEDNGPATTEP